MPSLLFSQWICGDNSASDSVRSGIYRGYESIPFAHKHQDKMYFEQKQQQQEEAA